MAFWTSTYINEEHGSDWVLWSLGNEFYTCTNSTSWLLTPSTGARIATVDSHQDLVELTEKYKAKKRDEIIRR